MSNRIVRALQGQFFRADFLVIYINNMNLIE